MDIDNIASRSYQRVADRLPDDASLDCPYCGRPLTVRHTTLGYAGRVGDEMAYVDGVQLKCAGDDGCGHRPDFDVPMAPDEYEQELDRRDGHRSVNMADSLLDDDERTDRLRALGYLPQHAEAEAVDAETDEAADDLVEEMEDATDDEEDD